MSKFNDNTPEKTIVTIDERLSNMVNVKDDSFKYNWVDARDYAKKIFWNYAFELAWAEDMWNILMFDEIVNSKNIVSTEHNGFENGDMILWLVSMYDLFFDYKVQLDLEHEFNREPFIEYTYRIDDADFYLRDYFEKAIKKEVNEGILNGEIPYDYFYNDTCVEIDDYYYKTIFDDVLYKEVIRRKEVVINKIYNHFNNDYYLIMYFMQGVHWYDNYLNVNNYIDNENCKVIKKYEQIQSFIRGGNNVRFIDDDTNYLYEYESEVESRMERELMELEQYFNRFKSDIDSYAAYAWVASGMRG